MSGVEGVAVEVPARDGFRLAATLYRPAQSVGVVQINCAIATRQRFYRHFAAGLAGAGYTVLTWDYRGIGGSRRGSLREFASTSIRDWVELDMAGVLDWVRAELAPERTFLVGHSLGGQVAGLLDNAQEVSGMLTLAAQSGYWGLQGGEQKLVLALHAHLVMPLLARALGYLPWRGNSGGIPRRAGLDFASWCRKRGYLLGDDSLPIERYAGFEAPVLALSFADDKWGTAKAVDAMMSAYPNVVRRHVTPQEVGLGSLGHFGFFRPGARALWDDAIAWLDGIRAT